MNSRKILFGIFMALFLSSMGFAVKNNIELKNENAISMNALAEVKVPTDIFFYDSDGNLIWKEEVVGHKDSEIVDNLKKKSNLFMKNDHSIIYLVK
jgi:hypothetical protein